MDKEIAEIREGLANLQNDVDYLLNLHARADTPLESTPLTAFEPNANLYDVMVRITSIQQDINIIVDRLNEHEATHKKKRKGRYL